MRHDRLKILFLGALASGALVAGLAAPALAEQDKPKVDPPGEVLEMSEHYDGGVAQTGEFPGKLVCVRSKESLVPLSAEQCGPSDRVYALEMSDDKAMRPVKAGNEQVEQQMNELLGKSVTVVGRFHTGTGMLIASSVREKDPA